MPKNLMNLNFNKYAPWVVLLLLVLNCFSPGPALMGNWESLTFYHTFAAVNAPLSFLISPRANVGGQGYALLEFARPIVNTLGLSISLNSFRLVSAFCGAISLILFFIITKRYFGAWPAIGSTALLATNQMFYQYEHSMTVVIVSFATLLFFMERLQTLETNYWSCRSWLWCGFAFAINLLNYGPARVFSIILFIILAFKILINLRSMPEGLIVRQMIYGHAMWALLGIISILILFDKGNFLAILRPHNIFFPSDAEAMSYLLEGGAGGFSEMIFMNTKVLLDSFFNYDNYHSNYSSFLIGDYRYRLINTPVLLFAIIGVYISVVNIRLDTLIFRMPYLNILVIFAVFTLPLLLSTVVYRAEGPLATLSSHRLFFSLIPLHLLVAVFLKYLNDRLRTNKVKAMMAAGFFFLVIFMGNEILKEDGRFRNKIYVSEGQEKFLDLRSFWLGKDKGGVDRDGYEYISHFEQHSQYAIAAIKMAEKIKAHSLADQNSKKIIYVNVNNFNESLLAPSSLPYLAFRNFHSIFLTAYLGENGLDVNPIIMLKSDRSLALGGLDFFGKPREFSALMKLGNKDDLKYDSKEELVPYLLRMNGKKDFDILVTTPEELNGARSLLSQEKIPFEVINFDKL